MPARTRRRTTIGTAAGAAVLALALGAPLTPGAEAGRAHQAARASASLTFTPNGAYIAGQAITLVGQLPVAGVRKVWVEFNMNRPGDTWTELIDRPYTATTKADGSFALPARAPSMWGISWRVRGASGGGVTPSVTFDSKTQDVEMTTVNPNNTSQVIVPKAGKAFVVAADSTPTLFKRPDTIGLPVLQGRTMTLQRRTSPTAWETIATTAVGANGMGYFPSMMEADPGTYVYRVRLERWTPGETRIGWTASYPTYVTVTSMRPGPSERASAPVARATRVAAQRVPHLRSSETATAAAKYGWRPTQWSFDWEEGQDLDSPPNRGTDLAEGWLQYSDGTGRVSKHNGGLRVDSGRLLNTKSDTVDFGTTRAIQTGHADAYGRWEVRLRTIPLETGAQDFDVLIDLVPASASKFACGKRNITIARWDDNGSKMTFGANAMTSQWTKTITTPTPDKFVPAVAVEVAKKHITWFLDGQTIGSVRSRAAVTGVPLVLRMSLVGSANAEYNNTGLLADWQRSFTLAKGTQVKNGPALAKKQLTGCVE